MRIVVCLKDESGSGSRSYICVTSRFVLGTWLITWTQYIGFRLGQQTISSWPVLGPIHPPNILSLWTSNCEDQDIDGEEEKEKEEKKRK
jgi:hypothetical protein